MHYNIAFIYDCMSSGALSCLNKNSMEDEMSDCIVKVFEEGMYLPPKISQELLVYQSKIERVGEEGFQNFERVLMLQTIDHQWREHLSALDHLRQGIHLRGYAQKNPKQEYKREAFELFSMMLDRVKANVSGVLMNVQIQEEEQVAQAEQNILAHEQAAQAQMHLQHEGDEDLAREQSVTVAGANYVDEQGNAYQVGRNEPCPCGSGKKFKQCHGKLK